MDGDGPPILRPIPRRPFSLNQTIPTLEDDHTISSDTPSAPSPPSGIDLSSPHFLNTNLDRTDSTPSLTRPTSFLNLTSSTLMGIYSEAASRTLDSPGEYERSETPWGTGARTPRRRPSIDDATYELMYQRSHPAKPITYLGSSRRAEDAAASPSLAGNALSLILRGVLLCVLGLGYGVIVTRLHNEDNHLPRLLDDSIMKPGSDWRYIGFWGAGGVVLGSLLPWFDTLWASAFDGGSEKVVEDDARGAAPGTDWALVMRAVGAFVGILFAIRKLAWASTLQVSAALALVNPLLWWLIDRSKPGFVLSAAVGLTGSVVLLSLNGDVGGAPHVQDSLSGLEDETFVLLGLAGHEAIETAMYMLSVLFCSCLCFGNIGRRLAWNQCRGRWGGVR
ncbi:hypothetical protein E4U60_006179 [Claviceps pazoutovae]|uniref:INSIG domain-containing protein n=1 Tax=Claviceps pazoutovae TaxID=1649127 RepID=A0A9P7SI64_9HYPO|nr:hypothetical protein E4U60_006179 [Claviceps pazoutovae]